MSKNWKDKGWNNMESLLDQAMPVQRRPLLPPFPIQLRIVTFTLIIIGSAYWGFNLINSGKDLTALNAFDLSSTPDISSEKVQSQLLRSSDHASVKKATLVVSPISRMGGNFSSNSGKSTVVENKTEQSSSTEIIDNLKEADMVQVSEESVGLQDMAKSSLNEVSNIEDSKSSDLYLVYTPDREIILNEVFTSGNESENEHQVSDTKIVQIETSPIINPKLNTAFSIGASAGNYTFSGPTMYGQLHLNIHVPISKSFNMTFLAGAGKGLLYQNTEVLLSEYSNHETNGTILGSEAPGDDLSAYLDIKSVSNTLLGTQLQWQISNKWSFAIGASAVYLFNIKHQALQSGSLVPVGQSPQQIFTPSEISERFAHWNQWDLRMNASLQYHMTSNWSLAMSYNRGFTNLLKHPISSEHIIQMNNLALGLNFRF